MAEHQSLFCDEAGARGNKGTILLIHGALGSWHDFDLNIPYLESDYHLLLPDLPGHGRSQDIRPYSSELSAKLLADTIREKAEGGRAHIIGFSMGMSVALELISKYPELVNDVFITGYKRFSGEKSKYLGHAYWFSTHVEAYVPGSLKRWLMDGIDLPPPVTPCTLPLCKDIMVPRPPPTSETDWPSPWPARTLIMCAGKSGILPTADHPDAARKLRDIARELNAKTVAYTHPLMRHPWLRQDPKLFAQTARLWFEKGEVPDGFVEL